MKLFKRILIGILAVLPIVYTSVAVFFFLPDTVAAHFGINGQPDRWGSKYEAYLLPAIILVVWIILLAVERYLRRSQKYGARTERSLDAINTANLCLFTITNAVCIYILMLMGNPALATNSAYLINAITPTIVGVVFIILGNILPKTRRNSFIGMRMRFTMDTEQHWYIANRAGGIAMVISGLVTVAAGLILRNITYIFWMTGALLVTLTVAIIYSYVKIKGETKR